MPQTNYTVRNDDKSQASIAPNAHPDAASPVTSSHDLLQHLNSSHDRLVANVNALRETPWMLVDRESTVNKVGSYVVHELLGESVIDVMFGNPKPHVLSRAT